MKLPPLSRAPHSFYAPLAQNRYISTTQVDCVHGSDGLRSHIMNHRTTNSICYASFGVRSYHWTPFAVQWNVRKASIASLTLD
ncbi:hypothetical protein TNCV_1042271 [Trichonephila clavipes]|nr:hypothetical protein TNCV_1042271 [Trichonephila clavipes]